MSVLKLTFRSDASCPLCGRKLFGPAVTTLDTVLVCIDCFKLRLDQLQQAVDTVRRRLNRRHVSLEHGLLLFTPQYGYLKDVCVARRIGELEIYPEPLNHIP